MKGSWALVTGATSGIGLEIAKLHASNSGNLILASRDLYKLEKTQKQLIKKFEIDVKIIQIDLSIENAAESLYLNIKELDLEIEYLINNAGFGGYGFFQQRDQINDLEMIRLNIITLTMLMHLFLKDFVVRKHGKILNVSSSAALMPGPMQAVYFATKAYVKSLTNAVAREVKSTGVTITNLMPAPTKTAFIQRSNVTGSKMFRDLADPKTIALEGYSGMLEGKLNILSGFNFWQKIRLKIIPLVPENIILNFVYKAQNKEFKN